MFYRFPTLLNKVPQGGSNSGPSDLKKSIFSFKPRRGHLVRWLFYLSGNKWRAAKLEAGFDALLAEPALVHFKHVANRLG